MHGTALPTVLEDTVFEERGDIDAASTTREGFREDVAFEEGSSDEEDDEGLQRERWRTLRLRTALSDDVAVDVIIERWHLLSAGAKVLWEIKVRGSRWLRAIDAWAACLMSVSMYMCGQVDEEAQDQDAGANGRFHQTLRAEKL